MTEQTHPAEAPTSRAPERFTSQIHILITPTDYAGILGLAVMDAERNNYANPKLSDSARTLLMDAVERLKHVDRPRWDAAVAKGQAEVASRTPRTKGGKFRQETSQMINEVTGRQS